MKWVTKIPAKSGYYWVKLYNLQSEPVIVFLNKMGVVLRIGTSKTDVSTYYDVVAWSNKPIKMFE